MKHFISFALLNIQPLSLQLPWCLVKIVVWVLHTPQSPFQQTVQWGHHLVHPWPELCQEKGVNAPWERQDVEKEPHVEEDQLQFLKYCRFCGYVPSSYWCELIRTKVRAKAPASYLQTSKLLSNVLTLEQRWNPLRGSVKQAIPSLPKDVIVCHSVWKTGRVKGKLTLKTTEAKKMFLARCPQLYNPNISSFFWQTPSLWQFLLVGAAFFLCTAG